VEDYAGGQILVETEKARFFWENHEPVGVMAMEIVRNTFLYARGMGKMNFGKTAGQLVFPLGKGRNRLFFVIVFFYGYMDEIKPDAEKVSDLLKELDGNGNPGAEVFVITRDDDAVNGVENGIRRDNEDGKG